MDEDSDPIAMCSGMLIGMMMGATLLAGTLAWRAATATLCNVIATEAGRNNVAECPRLNLK